MKKALYSWSLDLYWVDLRTKICQMKSADSVLYSVLISSIFGIKMKTIIKISVALITAFINYIHYITINSTWYLFMHSCQRHS